jgi:hypothetical protein
VTITPAANQSGSATITLTVSDGTLTTSDTFVLTVNAVTGDGFAEWLMGFDISDTDPATDSDNDGIPNVVEYVIGGNPKNMNDTALLPTGVLVEADPDDDSTASAYLLFTYRRTDRSARDPLLAIHVEWTTDFVGPWITADETHGVVIIESDDEAGENVDLIHAYVPMPSTGKLFARLGVTISPP